MTDKKSGKKSEKSSEEVRADIMEAARKHFATVGYQGANLKDIAGDAGVANSLINYHFEDKEGLLKACMEPFARGRMEAILRILKDPKSRDEIKVRIQMFAEEIITSFMNDPFSFEIIDREVRAGNPIILKIFENTMLQAFKGVVEMFKQAKKNGLLHEDVDPLVASTVLFVSCCDVARKDILAQKFFGRSLKDPEWRRTYSEQIVNLFAHGVLK